MRHHKDGCLEPGEEDDDVAEDAVGAVSSSPLPHEDLRLRSSVEPESGTSDRTPPTSPATLGHSHRPASLAIDSAAKAGMQSPRRLAAVSAQRGYSPSQDQPLPKYTPDSITAAKPSGTKPNRKRKFASDHGEPSSSENEDVKDHLSRLSGPSNASRSDVHLNATQTIKSGSETEAEPACHKCPGNRKACTHPLYGTPVPLHTNHPGLIYNDRTFTDNDRATEDQIRYVISRLPCRIAETVHRGWEIWRVGHPDKQNVTKYECLAKATDYLNPLVLKHCPEFVDLTLES